MMAKSRVNLFLCILALASFFTGAAHAQIMKKGNDTLTSLQFRSDRLQVNEASQQLHTIPHKRRLLSGYIWSYILQ